MGMSSVFQENLESLFSCLNYLCKLFSKYLKMCDKARDYPFPRPGSTPTNPASTNKEFSWEWLTKEDPDIIIMSISGVNLDEYTRKTIIQAAHFLGIKVLQNQQYTQRYFEILINILEKDCIDETILIEVVKCAREVLLSTQRIPLDSSPAAMNVYQQDISKIFGKMIEKMQGEYELASNELYELIYDYLKGVTDLKEHHKKIHNYTLIQLRNKSLSLRNKFFSLFDQYYGRSIYKKLQHIFLQQNWYFVKDVKDHFWIQQALDLLMSSIDDEVVMQREPDGVVLLSFQKVDNPGLPDVMIDSPPVELEKIISANKLVTEKLKREKTKYWLNPLKDVTNWEHHICEKLWLKLFPQFWNIMSADEQQQIACLIEPFLAKEEFVKQMQGKRPNSIRTIFEGVASCDPMPKISPEVIQYIGKNYGAWHTAIPVLESYLYAFPNNERFGICMQVLYKRLAENEYSIGLQRYIAKSSITQAGLTYTQFHMWEAAYDLFASATSKYIKTSPDREHISEIESSDFLQGSNDEVKKTLSQIDLRIWEEGLIESAQQLNQWENLKVVGVHTHKMSIILQYDWSNRNWANFSETSKKMGEGECSVASLAQLYSHIQKHANDDDTERDNIYKKGLKALYTEWNILPNIIDVSHYSSIILQQHFLESSEFKNMYKEVKDALNRQVDPDLKTTLNSWRERLPNKCESFSVWRDLLECRNFLFNQLITKLSNGNKLEKIEHCFHDIPWNYLKLAEIARKHNLIDQALYYLGEVDRYLKDSGDAHNYEKFLRAKETAKICMFFSNEWNEAVEYLKSMERKPFFQKNAFSKSEILRLEGELYHLLDNSEAAETSLKAATEACTQNYKAWASYAIFCDKVYEKKKIPAYNANALKGSIFASIYMISKAKYYIPKIFSYLEREVNSSSPGEASENTTINVFSQYAKDIPVWVWIYWIPQLFANLSRSNPERNAARSILKNISYLYPQPLFLYYHRFSERLGGVDEPKSDRELVAVLEDLSGGMRSIEREAQKLECITMILNELERKVLASFNKEDELLLNLRQIYVQSLPISETTTKTVENLLQKVQIKYFDTDKEEYLYDVFI